MSLFSCGPRALKKYLITCMNAGLVPFVTGQPGIGKSDIVRQIAKEYNLEVIDIRLAQADITDLNGLPRFKDNRAEFVPFNIFPLEDSPLPKNKQGWLVFLDEFNSAPRSIQAAAYRILLDRQVGNHNLHPHCVLMAAGNRKEDKAIVNDLSTATLSRLVHFQLDVNKEEWMYDYAIPNQLDGRLIAFINAFPDKLNTFDPEKSDKTFSCPRTIAFLDKLIKSKEQLGNPNITDEDLILFSGCVGDGVATEFINFVKVFTQVPKYADIVKDPVNTPIPDESALKWATITSLVQNADKKDSAQFIKYVSNFDVSFQIVFLRMLLKKDGLYLSDKPTKQLILSLSQYLGDLNS